jgi:hypothetical protein
MDAIGPTTLGKVRLAVFFGLEPGYKLAEVHHGGEYSVSGAWCQVPDNRHPEEPAQRASRRTHGRSST